MKKMILILVALAGTLLSLGVLAVLYALEEYPRTFYRSIFLGHSHLWGLE